MVKSEILKEIKSNFIPVGRTVYLKIPQELIKDSNFPFSSIFGKKIKIKMFKDKLVVEEE